MHVDYCQPSGVRCLHWVDSSPVCVKSYLFSWFPFHFLNKRYKSSPSSRYGDEVFKKIKLDSLGEVSLSLIEAQQTFHVWFYMYYYGIFNSSSKLRSLKQ